MLRDSAYMWIAPLIAMVVAQVLKPIIIMLQMRRFDWQRMRKSGGMPSSHTALVVALVTELWLREGGSNAVFALSIFVALIVMYDAAGVRWQTGRQAAVLNRLLHDLQGNSHLMKQDQRREAGLEEGTPTEVSQVEVPQIPPLTVAEAPWWLVDWPVLNEHVGHKPIEVLGGCIVGVLVALWLH